MQPAPGKNGYEKLGNQFTVNWIPLKEITRQFTASSVLVVTQALLTLRL